jgi:hypothetical protein
MHEMMAKYIAKTNGHRNLCRVVDYELTESYIYIISESYNFSLYDLYCTSQAEKTQLSQEFLVETSF